MRPLGERESSSSKTIKGIRCTSAKLDRLLPVGMRALRDSVSDEWEWQEIGERRKARGRDLNTLVLVRPKEPAAARKEIFCYSSPTLTRLARLFRPFGAA